MAKRTLPKKSSKVSIAIEPEVAIAIIGLFSAVADGKGISTLEESALTDFLSQIGLFDDYSDEDFAELTEKVTTLIEENDPEELVAQAIAALPDEGYREAAYITGILMVGIDEEVVEDEQEYISELQEALGISDDRAQELIDEVFGEDDEDEDEDEEDDE
jgi:hypothetical protein